MAIDHLLIRPNLYTPKPVRRWSTGNWAFVITTTTTKAPPCGVDPSWDTGTVEYTKAIIAAEGSI